MEKEEKKLILAIDSSSIVASVALVNKETVIAEYTINLKKTHSQTLLPMIDEIFKMTGIEKKELKAVAVTSGPGSFTGLRIGAATAKGMALALGIPIIDVPTLEGMAYNYNHCNKLICPIMDARRSQVYTGIYRCSDVTLENIISAGAFPISEIVDKLNELNEEVVFIGDGIPVFTDVIDETLKVKHYYAKQHQGRQRAGSVGAIAWLKYDNKKYMDSDSFAPNYFRMSQAERERLENGS